MAVLVWGRPRFTADIDLVVEFKKTDVERLAHALQQLGEQGYVDRQMMQEALERGGEFNFIDGVSGMKVDFWVLKDSAFDRSRLQRRVAQKILGETVYFSSPEDLILAKLLWFKEAPMSRQAEDIVSVLKISGDQLDQAYLRMWTQKLEVEEEFDRIKTRKYL
jgi:hypothetical protein